MSRLDLVWTARTGDWSHRDGQMTGGAEGCARCHREQYKFEATPIIADGKLVLSTPFNRVIALDPATGSELWRHDPKLELGIERNEGLMSRGVAYWSDGVGADTLCGRRIFFGTVDARLFALDARTGVACLGFGDGGTVRLDRDVGSVQRGQYGVTSPPVVVDDIIIVGSSSGDNRRVDVERGTVRGFDVRTGSLLWAFDPIPRSARDPAWHEWTPEASAKTGAANAWAPMSADPARGLVFVPVGSAAPDFYGGKRPGSNRHANSVLALEAATGRLRWAFQVVHHDLWDYDVAAQPTVLAFRRGNRDVPAVVAATKTGFLFFLDPGTGQPLFPVEERPVPASTVPGERAAPTQPFPTLPGPLHPLGVTENDLWGATSSDLEFCRSFFRSMSTGEFFAPPSLEGIIQYPGFGGGVNWGGVAFDRGRGLLVVNHMRLPMWVRLARRTAAGTGNQRGTPYTMSRGAFVAPSGLPCVKPPWSVLTAIDLSTGNTKWEVPFGNPGGMDRPEGSEPLGSVTLGGPMVTAGGLVFIAATSDEHIRAFDVDTGASCGRRSCRRAESRHR